MYKKILDFLFPNVCGFCGIKTNERYTCEKCLNVLEYYKEKPYIPSINEMYYDKIICEFKYEGILRAKMLSFKFKNKRYIARSFGDILSRSIMSNNIKADLIIPVPICKSRYFERGYNQSECIAKYMAELSNIKLERDVLYKTKNNQKQSYLNAKQRKDNVRSVYEIKNKERIINKSVILVDDIYTTGATINECSRVLKKAGVKEVIAMTFLYSSK